MPDPYLRRGMDGPDKKNDTENDVDSLLRAHRTRSGADPNEDTELWDARHVTGPTVSI
ncbi:hypothetical protein GCM10011326_26170 [Salipiger profundus]|nr:hypothetical protein GCM10011326_26170 [Salipiger profundus]